MKDDYGVRLTGEIEDLPGGGTLDFTLGVVIRDSKNATEAIEKCEKYIETNLGFNKDKITVSELHVEPV